MYRGTAGKPPGGWGFFFTFQMRLAQKKTPGGVSTYFEFLMYRKPELVDERSKAPHFCLLVICNQLIDLLAFHLFQ